MYWLYKESFYIHQFILPNEARNPFLHRLFTQKHDKLVIFYLIALKKNADYLRNDIKFIGVDLA